MAGEGGDFAPTSFFFSSHSNSRLSLLNLNSTSKLKHSQQPLEAQLGALPRSSGLVQVREQQGVQ